MYGTFSKLLKKNGKNKKEIIPREIEGARKLRAF